MLSLCHVEPCNKLFPLPIATVIMNSIKEYWVVVKVICIVKLSFLKPLYHSRTHTLLLDLVSPNHPAEYATTVELILCLDKGMSRML